MKLIRAEDSHVTAIKEWFPDRRSCQVWGGPQFRFPFTDSTFLEDTRSHVLPSYVLLGTGDRLLGFGQYYSRAGRCHLARLVISPEHRGAGLGRWFIGSLAELGIQELGAGECSLFVAPDNARAIRLYRSMGFMETQYPEDDASVASAVYMVVHKDRLTALSRRAQ
ncbi:GNAT family N-acetyltransferase [Sorangium sp. So ce1000]|uniref:GNAT family N-acetyltransferase n=1 Tax=Sorangium sp. So ce1000 TaxID=3133325 RepID=UPI003F614D37